jgi:lipoprotein-releasing system ATP-binding protein
MAFIHARNLHKTYRLGRVDVPVLRGVSIEVGKGESLAILGASGSGKSTLLHLLGGLDRPDRAPEGSIEHEGRPLGRMSSAALDDFRSRHVGFVFQFYHLFPELTVLENVLVSAMVKDGVGYPGARPRAVERARGLLEMAGLSHRLGHRPAELSGGERQRVAIARALINAPPVLLADEPTGNLDRATGRRLLDFLDEVRGREGMTMVVVTHDQATAERATRVLKLDDGVLAGEVLSR